MKQITLENLGPQSVLAHSPCTGRLLALGAVYGVAMLVLWQLAGPAPLGHALAWGLAALAGLKLWNAAEGAR